MSKDTLISDCSEHIAEDMFQHLCAYIGANLNKICGHERSFSLIGVAKEICAVVSLPEDCSLKFKGYDMLLETPMPIIIKFGCEQLWIGARNITIRFKEEVVSLFRYLITDLLPSALEEFRSILSEVNRRYLKAEKLRSILESNAETLIKAAVEGTGLKCSISFHPLTATLTLRKKGQHYSEVAVLHYESFDEDLQKAITIYGN